MSDQLRQYREAKAAEGAANREAYLAREQAVIDGLTQATGLPFLSATSSGGVWVPLDAAEKWLAERSAT